MTERDPGTGLADRRDVNTVLVTGAAGFIGSHVGQSLAAGGTNVVGVDNFDPYYQRLDKELNVDCLRRSGGDFREADVRDYGSIASLIDVTRPDVVVHLAAKAGVRNSIRFPRQYFETNVIGTQNVLDSCRALGVERLVVGSTSSVYGATDRVPFAEDDVGIEPLHPYAASKRAAEILASTYARLYELQITMLRFFTVYGERGRPDMMPRLLLDSITNGTPVPLFTGPLGRDWTHVDDVTRAVVAAVERPLGFGILNVGRGEPVLLADFIAELVSVAGKEPNLIPTPRPETEMVSTFARTDRLRDQLGVEPTISVRAGVERLWDWWQGYLVDQPDRRRSR